MAQLAQERGSKHTGVIVANPNTGEILAMADSPTFNLNSPRDLSAYYSEEEIENLSDAEETNALYDIWRNFCVSDTFEAGSTIKPLTIGAALDENNDSIRGTAFYAMAEKIFLMAWVRSIFHVITFMDMERRRFRKQSCGLVMML